MTSQQFEKCNAVVCLANIPTHISEVFEFISAGSPKILFRQQEKDVWVSGRLKQIDLGICGVQKPSKTTNLPWWGVMKAATTRFPTPFLFNFRAEEVSRRCPAWMSTPVRKVINSYWNCTPPQLNNVGICRVFIFQQKFLEFICEVRVAGDDEVTIIFRVLLPSSFGGFKIHPKKAWNEMVNYCDFNLSLKPK